MRYLAVLFILSLSLGCTKLELENQDLPDVETLTPGDIETNLKVVDITVDQGVFDYMYSRYDDKIVIDAQVRMLTPDGDTVFSNRPIKMEVRGASSAGYEMKPLGMVFETPVSNHKSSVLAVPEILDHHNLDQLYTLRLRNSGNDFGVTMIKDLAYTRLAVQMGIDVELMYGEPVHAFVNGEYYGLLNLRTESGPLGVAGLLQKDPENVSVMQLDKDNGNIEIEEGNGMYATQIHEYATDGRELKLYQMLDISNFIDYIIFQDYIGNYDWPHNNVRAHTVAGSPVRFILYDLDYAAYNTQHPNLPGMEYKEDDVSRIYQALLEIPEFRRQFKERQKELYRKFSPAAFNAIVDEMALQLEAEIPYLIAKYNQPQDKLKWKTHLDALKREYERKDHFIRKKYDL